jgi:hypothetical protein
MIPRWRQVLLLLVYFLVLMLVARVIDLLIWWVCSKVIFWAPTSDPSLSLSVCRTHRHLQGLAPNQEVDPRLVLGVRQLKALLDTRGVGYAGCVEKHELAELVYNSGDKEFNKFFIEMGQFSLLIFLNIRGFVNLLDRFVSVWDNSKSGKIS